MAVPRPTDKMSSADTCRGQTGCPGPPRPKHTTLWAGWCAWRRRILGQMELMHMLRTGQLAGGHEAALPVAAQCAALAAEEVSSPKVSLYAASLTHTFC